jgi:hypothetical protein
MDPNRESASVLSSVFALPLSIRVADLSPSEIVASKQVRNKPRSIWSM